MAEAGKLKVVNTDHDFSGFDYLARLHAEAASVETETISLEMGNVNWFSAIMAAPLKVIADHWVATGKRVTVGSDPLPRTYETLCRNHFLCYYGRDPVQDGYSTSIPVTLLPDRQDLKGADFLMEKVARSPYFPSRMSPRFKRHLLTSFGEAFSNVRQHAETSNVVACGQYYVAKQRLAVIVADGGVTIPHKVLGHVPSRLSPVDAVRWAMDRGTRLGVMVWAATGCGGCGSSSLTTKAL
jgi:hypothetical protein